MDEKAVQQVIDDADARRDAMLKDQAAAPYPPEGPWHYEDFALAAYFLNQRTTDADKAILTLREAAFPETLKNGDFHWHAYLLERGSVYNDHWSVQNKGVLIVQRLKTTNAKGQMVWFDNSLERTEKGGWIFAAAPRAYAAVRVVQAGAQWKPDSVEQHREGKGPYDLGMWLVCEDEFSPVIIEVARRSDCKDFEAFQSAILSNPLKREKKRLDYTSQLHKTTLTLFADYARPPRVDGKPVDYAPQKVYDSPFVESAFDSGVVTIRKDTRTLVLDFNR